MTIEGLVLAFMNNYGVSRKEAEASVHEQLIERGYAIYHSTDEVRSDHVAQIIYAADEHYLGG